MGESWVFVVMVGCGLLDWLYEWALVVLISVEYLCLLVYLLAKFLVFI